MIIRSLVFFFNDTATTEIYTLSLHDALPISVPADGAEPAGLRAERPGQRRRQRHVRRDRRLPAGAAGAADPAQELAGGRSEEHTSELQSQSNLVCRLLLENNKTTLHPSRPHY